MPNPIRQLLMDNLFSRLKQIQVVNGYFTDIGKNGFRWKTTDFAAVNVPGFTLNDVDQTSVEAPTNLRGYVVSLEISCAIAAAGVTPNSLIQADADIFKCIGADPFFDGIGRPGAAHIHYTGTEFAVKHEESIISGLKAKYELKYRTKLWDPTTS